MQFLAHIKFLSVNRSNIFLIIDTCMIQKIKEILPRIGYTSLPILAVSSLENRGIIELMKELASMTVRGSLPVKEEEDLVERAFELQRVHAAEKEAIEMKKVMRSWTSATKFEKRGIVICAAPYSSFR